MNRHIQGMLLTKIRAAERAIAPLLTRGLTEISGAADKQGLVQELGQFAETAEKTLRHEEQGKYREIADTLLQAARALPVPADAAQTAPACALIADVLQETERMLSTEKLKKIFVFLPYKASMWDSLESIYLAAAEDKEQCEPYVVPIPYADLNPDHTAKEWHCEVKEYPENIPVEDWNDFTIDTLRLMRPDVIFIHNPYDDLNRVTSIHPQYYSEKLKTATDCLVYVPYDVPITVTGEAFIQTKGVVNADYVIVKDKANKEQFERYYPGGNPPQGKILPLGSPKIDKVLSVKREDFTLPKAWQDIVVGKKVILYNTSIDAYMRNTDKVCQKLRNVFHFFQEHKDEYALWWRPHPLMEAAFKAMRPAFWKEYEQIVTQYKRAGWGIYDDTADLDRAIIHTDAYYGDPSSVVALYRATGKSILYQDFQSEPEASRKSLMISMEAVADKTGIWGSSAASNAVFHIDFEKQCVDKLSFLPIPSGENLVNCLVLDNDFLYLASYGESETDLWRYNIQTGVFTALSLGLTEAEKTVFGKFAFAVRYKEKITFWGKNIAGVIVLDIKKKDVHRVKNIFDPLPADLWKNQGFADYHIQQKDVVYTPLFGTSYLLEYNLVTEKYCWHRIGENPDERFFALDMYQNKIVLTNATCGEVVWDKKEGVSARYQYVELPDNDHVWSGSCWHYFIRDGFVIYFPATYACFFYRHIGEKDLHKVEYPIQRKDCPDGIYAKPAFLYWCGEKLYFQDCREGKIYCCDFSREQFDRIDICLTDRQVEKIQNQMADSPYVQSEQYLSTEVWLGRIVKASKFPSNVRTSSGERIYNRLMREATGRDRDV